MANYTQYCTKLSTKNRLTRKQARRTTFLTNKKANKMLKEQRRAKHDAESEENSVE